MFYADSKTVQFGPVPQLAITTGTVHFYGITEKIMVKRFDDHWHVDNLFFASNHRKTFCRLY